MLNEFDSLPAPLGTPSTHTTMVVTVLADDLGVNGAKHDKDLDVDRETRVPRPS